MLNQWSERLEVVSLTVADLAAALRIEAASPSPWSGESIRDEIGSAGGLHLAARLNGTCVGWCCCRCFEGVAELLKIAVAPQQRRCHVAARLLGGLLFRLESRRVRRVFLEVRAANLPAVSLYHKYGFTEIGRRTNYYVKPQDDALIMNKSIPTVRRPMT